MNHIIRTIDDFLSAHSVHLEPGVDLVLDEYTYQDGSKGCQYYFVNHLGRTVFWIDNASSELFPVTSELNGMKSASHIRHELEAQYWIHCEYYPRAFEVTHEILDELREIVLHACGDVMTSKTSTVGWTIDDLKNMLSLIEGIGKNVGKHASEKIGGSGCFVGRFMHIFARRGVYNFHGQPGALLNLGQSVYATVQKRTMSMKILSPLCFSAPDSHLFGLRTIHTDRLIPQREWPEFVRGLTSQWQEFTLYATVILNANVAFLAIQSVDNNGVYKRSPAQISSYLSTLLSIGSIICGLLLVNIHRNRDRDTPAEASFFIHFFSMLGYEMLAVMYSLPSALFMWSMVSFLVAFLFLCFQGSSPITRALVAAVSTVVAILFLWCLAVHSRESLRGWLREQRGKLVSYLRRGTNENHNDV
ncbi:hypothetical protein K438DRAFT_698068 [Mycena galopus ATCC 62051]|nr:hypothetical protein K438DRAFT_698068 [Mycena galopus ATCC 62051]